MNSTKRLAAQVAGAVAIAALIGTSAFADTRHSDATARDRSHQSNDHRGSRDGNRQSHDQRDNNSRSHDHGNNNFRPSQTFERHDGRGSAQQSFSHRDLRGNDRFDNRVQADNFRDRGFDRSRVFHNDRPAFDNRGRRSMSINGRVNRFVHERGGYRVWIDGGRFPVWIPEARIGLFPRLRVGLSLNFGGYYDPLGYLEAYDYYDAGAYGYGAYDSVASSSGVLRGVIETVDYRRGTLVLRDEASGNFVTTLIRDRRLEDLRPGDYAEISGDWTRNGVFEGLRLEDTNGGRY